MSETFFHLLGPGTQPNDDSFSMNPLPITCQVNDEPSMAALEQCAHSPQVIALLNELQHQLSERQPPLGEVLAVDLLNLNADDRHFMAGAQTSRRKVAGGQTGGWLRAAGVVAGGNAKSLADRFAVTAAH